MWVSKKAVTSFVRVNACLLFIAWWTQWVPVITRALARNLTVVLVIHVGTRTKPGLTHPWWTLRDVGYLLSSSAIQSATEVLLLTKQPSTRPFWVQLFFFELAVDFFHYWFHRLSHQMGSTWHRVHHRHVRPHLINTFCHHPLDLVLLESIPTLLAYNLFPLELSTAMVYKSFIEISGHSGKHLFPSSCFPTCVWLPRLLGIQLHSEDHALHHLTGTSNFSKRFSLWDKVFGTLHKQ
jgi:sterol desaturase/sphingolipid hydroxylase (fatty acid hydroxylase superfamily)